MLKKNHGLKASLENWKWSFYGIAPKNPFWPCLFLSRHRTILTFFLASNAKGGTGAQSHHLLKHLVSIFLLRHTPTFPPQPSIRWYFIIYSNLCCFTPGAFFSLFIYFLFRVSIKAGEKRLCSFAGVCLCPSSPPCSLVFCKSQRQVRITIFCPLVLGTTERWCEFQSHKFSRSEINASAWLSASLSNPVAGDWESGISAHLVHRFKSNPSVVFAVM